MNIRGVSAILDLATLVSGVQLLLKMQILPLTVTTLEGFCQLGKKRGSQQKVVPLCENGRKNATWFTQTTTSIKL